jgi:hypothetical protein
MTVYNLAQKYPHARKKVPLKRQICQRFLIQYRKVKFGMLVAEF